MVNSIMVGCDLHDKSMLLAIAAGRGRPVIRSWGTAAASRQAMIADLKRRADQAGTQRISFAFEACGFGFTLHDELMEAGIESHVLAPSKMERSPKRRKGKTDEKDAIAIFEILRGHVLAGNKLPSVWVPDLATRDDRELVRLRLTAVEDATRVKLRIRWLLKRNGLEKALAEAWSVEYWRWLGQLADGGLAPGAGAALASLMRQLEWQSGEIARLDTQVLALSQTERYAPVVAALRRHSGVGVLTAMVFLSEMGDMSRFSNRRQVGAFLGLSPSCFESGEADDRKGHITRQGPSRVRKVLCQAVWSRLRRVESERVAYERLVERNPKHKKIAVVARMRTLAVRLWHTALEAQPAMPAA